MKFTRKYFGIIILIGPLLAFLWPTAGLSIKPFIIYILGTMMFLSCLKINLGELKTIKTEWRHYLILLAMIFLLPPILTFLPRQFILENNDLYVGMMLTATMPCGIAIVFITDLLRGYSTKALVSTTLAHILSPILSPFIFWLFVHKIIEVNFLEIIILILKLIIVPLAMAQIVRRFSLHKKIVKVGNNINILLLIIIIWGLVSPTRELILQNLNLSLMAVGLVIIIMFLAAIIVKIFGRNDKEDITCIVTVTIKNFTLSSVIALSLFGEMALLGSVIYGIVGNLIIVPLQIIYRNK